MKLVRVLWLLPAFLLMACGETDRRTFELENVLFETLPIRVSGSMQGLDEARRTQIANGLMAICQGHTEGARALLQGAGIGREIYRLSLIAAKANRKGRCDYSDWAQRLAFHGERFKQLVGSGDAPAVLLAALLDEQLPVSEQREIVQALAARHYGQAQAVYAAFLLQSEGAAATQPVSSEALGLLEAAAAQGVLAAHLQLASLYRHGRPGIPANADKACQALRTAQQLGGAVSC